MRLVAYYRVSTDKQGVSGLGLEAQQASVKRYAEGERGELSREFTEVESGKRADRPVLAEALAYAKRTRSKLVIAKLDRLARNVHFLSGLMESGVDFVACDNPNANRLTIHILAAVAEDEARRISERTKAALAAYKARGGKLGSPANLGHDARRKGARARREQSVNAYKTVSPLVQSYRENGMSLARIAERLNEQGITTVSGSRWSPTQVSRVLARSIS